MITTRDNRWLLSRLDFIWSNYFSDVKQVNPVFIQFGRYSRLRFGSIKMDPRKNHSIITISSMFKKSSIPEEIVDHTIAHELCHYTQGFSSPHQRTQRHPHAGGVVKKELSERHLVHLYYAYQKWLRSYRLELKDYYRNRGRII